MVAQCATQYAEQLAREGKVEEFKVEQVLLYTLLTGKIPDGVRIKECGK